MLKNFISIEDAYEVGCLGKIEGLVLKLNKNLL